LRPREAGKADLSLLTEPGLFTLRVSAVLEKEKLELSELSSSISELKTNLSSIESQEKVLAGDLAEWTAKAVKLRAGTPCLTFTSGLD
jgi:DNA-binding GntR family transcriptional regulator